jgi:hypothetical protein
MVRFRGARWIRSPPSAIRPCPACERTREADSDDSQPLAPIPVACALKTTLALMSQVSIAKRQGSKAHTQTGASCTRAVLQATRRQPWSQSSLAKSSSCRSRSSIKKHLPVDLGFRGERKRGTDIEGRVGARMIEIEPHLAMHM